MNDTPLFNIRLTKSYIEYVKKFYPEVDVSTLLDYAGITPYQLEDEGHWLTQEQMNRLNTILVQETGNPQIAREAGRYGPTSMAAGAVKQYMKGFITPSAAYLVLGKLLYPQLSRYGTIQTKPLGSNRIELIFTPSTEIAERPFQCENRMGMFEGIAKAFTGKFATIEHPTCLHNGGSECRYIITWQRSRAFLLKMIRNYLILLGLAAIVATFFVFDHQHDRLTSFLLISLITVGAILASVYTEKQELASTIHDEGEMAKHLLEETNLRYNHALLVQEIGQATSSILNIDQLLSHITDVLQKRLDFDRGTIMLTDEERLHLVYAKGYGYNKELEDIVKKTAFHLDKKESLGPLVVAFKEQRPFLIDNIDHIKEDVTPRTLEFMQLLGIRSFICVPIIYEGRAEGVLAVDNLQSKKPISQSDINLLMGIAPQIGISMNNARAYQRIRESEERFRALGENAPDIIYTLDADGAFNYLNPAWEGILGYTQEEAIGQYFIDFLKKEDVGRFSRYLDQIKNKKETITGATGVLLTKEGKERLFNISCSPNFGPEGNVIGAIGTIKDITELEKNVEILESTLQSTIDAMAVIVESKDPYTSGHQKRVMGLAAAIAEEMHLDEKQIEGIRMAAMIHDIGKINVPAEILNKPGKLSDIEFKIIKTHPEAGYHILKNIEFRYPVAQIVLQHHEKINGSGYPAGLKGDEILIESRVITVADVVEAMATDRPYRASLGMGETLKEIEQGAGTLYDRDAAHACLRLFEEKGFRLDQV